MMTKQSEQIFVEKAISPIALRSRLATKPELPLSVPSRRLVVENTPPLAYEQ